MTDPVPNAAQASPRTHSALRSGMPELCSHEGVWEGDYRFVDNDNRLLDRHRSLLVCRVTDHPRHPYEQTNISIWDDGRVWRMEYPARYERQAIWFDDELIAGHFSELDPAIMARTIVGTWVWKDPQRWLQRPCGDVQMYEMIQVSADRQHRSRTWQWLEDGRVVLRTLIEERRVSQDWRSWDREHPAG